MGCAFVNLCKMITIAKLAMIAVIVGLTDRTKAQLDEGSPCTLSSGNGICRSIERCPSVYKDLLSGQSPEVNCGFQGNYPIVCCPTTTSGTRTTTSAPARTTVSSKTTKRPSGKSPLTNARPARKMCAEYAKSVYGLVNSPVLSVETQMVNVSLCAIESKKLIVGGVKAEPKEFPHMAVIGYTGSGTTISWNCGGSLISNIYVLTAAHCLRSYELGEAKWVRLGDLNLRSNSDDAQPQDYRIVQKISHPQYKPPQKYNDIALLKLESPAKFNAFVRPACLSIEPTVRAGTKAVAAGWGIVDWFDEEMSDSLMKVTLPVVSYSTCRKANPDMVNSLPQGINDKIQFCASEEGKDTCQGDSGGPLVIYSKSETCMYDIIGITSFGQFCGSVTPGVYTRIYPYLTWIESIVWPA